MPPVANMSRQYEYQITIFSNEGTDGAPALIPIWGARKDRWVGNALTTYLL